jgi:nucleotide-binding universal stress UspA family protein
VKRSFRVNENVLLRNVLFATDFSAASMHALLYATGVARRFDSKLYIAHVASPEDYPSGRNSLEAAARVACREAELKISHFLNSAPCRDLPCEALVGNGDIWIGLSGFMRRHAADLLVMGTIGRTGMRNFLLGSLLSHSWGLRLPMYLHGLFRSDVQSTIERRSKTLWRWPERYAVPASHRIWPGDTFLMQFTSCLLLLRRSAPVGLHRTQLS